MPRPLQPDDELLSNRFTFAHKFLVPPAWIAVFGAASVRELLRPDHPRLIPYVFALVIGAFAFWHWGIFLKRVIATREGLRVSDYRREVLVPWDQIAAVGENRLVNTITIQLEAPTLLGSRFVFRPYTFRSWSGEHPAAALVRARATAARRG